MKFLYVRRIQSIGRRNWFIQMYSKQISSLNRNCKSSFQKQNFLFAKQKYIIKRGLKMLTHVKTTIQNIKLWWLNYFNFLLTYQFFGRINMNTFYKKMKIYMVSILSKTYKIYFILSDKSSEHKLTIWWYHFCLELEKLVNLFHLYFPVKIMFGRLLDFLL